MFVFGRKLHVYLDGSKFTVITDHSALQWLFNFNGPNKRLVRWSLELQPYRDDMTINYRQGRVHANVDPLSRAPLAVCNMITTSAQPSNDFYQRLRDGYKDDEQFSRIIEGLAMDPPQAAFDRFRLREDGVLIYMQPGDGYARICVPNAKDAENGRTMRADLLHECHDVVSCGHLGIAKTINKVAQRFYWHGLTKDVKDYVRSCHKCQQNKAGEISYGLHQPCPYHLRGGTQSPWTSLAHLYQLARVLGTWL